jgi:hypothetical protein
MADRGGSGGRAVLVADRVWARWRELDEVKKPSVTLVFSGDRLPEVVLGAVEEACGDALAAREEGLPALAEWRVGMCRVALAPGGVLIEISQGPDDFEGLVGLIVGGLERRGLLGTLDLLESGKVAELPEVMALVECRIRVRGERYRPGRRLRWRADPGALWELLQAGAGWCAGNPARVEASMNVGTMPRFAVDLGEGLEELLRDALARVGVRWFSLATAGLDRWRVMSVMPSEGRVSLFEANETVLASEEWRIVLDELSRFLVENHEQATYALVSHGSFVTAAYLGTSLAEDWPRRDGFDASMTREVAYENEFAPDAFALQLLGPGYAGRLPAGSSWISTDLGDGYVILEHASPERWFETPFGPFGGSRNATSPPYDPPDVLAAARRDFTEILFQDELALADQA